MFTPHSSKPGDVDHLLRNAQLRDALEPLYDESIGRVNVEKMTTSSENEFLESMLDWERAPILPIYQWFEPQLELTAPDALDDTRLEQALLGVIDKLYEKRIVLDFTDHLTDRQLYCLIFRDILPTQEKMIDRGSNYLHWDCANMVGDPEDWLRFYANEQERSAWAEETGGYLPQVQVPPYPRKLPRAEL